MEGRCQGGLPFDSHFSSLQAKLKILESYQATLVRHNCRQKKMTRARYDGQEDGPGGAPGVGKGDQQLGIGARYGVPPGFTQWTRPARRKDRIDFQRKGLETIRTVHPWRLLTSREHSPHLASSLLDVVNLAAAYPPMSCTLKPGLVSGRGLQWRSMSRGP